MRILCTVVLLGAVACGGSQSPPSETAASAEANADAEADALIASAPPPPEVKPLEPQLDAERLFTLKLPGGAPVKGGSNAKVVLQVFSDFQCPFCASLVDTLHEVTDGYGELARIEWRNFPLPFHPDAANAAQAAVEVQAQAGDVAFWRYHDLLFQHQDDLSLDKLIEYAGQIEGVDSAKVRAAIDDGRHVERIQADMAALIESGAPAGTPATFINGRLISGAQPFEAFEAAIETSLKETPEQRAEAETLSARAYPTARARHILIQFKGSMRAGENITRTREEALKRAEELRAKAALGADFAELARENSDGPSGPQGGDLGTFTRGDLVPEFEAVVFGIQPGQIGPVVETPFGYHVILREQ